MKYIIILFFFATTSGLAQSPVIDIHSTHDYGDIPNAYYKDIENFYGQFVGTWVFSQNNRTLKVVFQKKEMFYDNIPPVSYYSDFLVGEFQYIENNIELANTLSNITINHSNINDYNIIGISKIDALGFPPCEDCPLTSKRLSMDFDEPANDDAGLAANFVIRRFVENGVEKLKVQFIMTSGPFGSKKDNFNVPSVARKHTIPYGDYTLIKQL